MIGNYEKDERKLKKITRRYIYKNTSEGFERIDYTLDINGLSKEILYQQVIEYLAYV